jgi:hypothetical protein
MVSVPEIVIVPTAIAFLPEAIDTLLNVCPLVIKKVEDRLDDDTVPSVGTPISLLLPRTLPLKVSVDNGAELKVIVLPDMA